MKTIICVISYYSFGFMQDCINSILKFLPNETILVIDNNPSVHDDHHRKLSYENERRWTNKLFTKRKFNNVELDLIKSKRKSKNIIIHDTDLLHFKQVKTKNSSIWIKQFCEAERDWLKQNPNTVMLKTDQHLTHGMAINYAVEWCHKQFVENILLIEADSLATGKQWYFNLVNGIENMWVVSGPETTNRRVPLTPTIWKVKKAATLDFKNVNDAPLFFEERGEVERYEDTAGSAYIACKLFDKLKIVEIPDFVHFWYGRSRFHHSAISFL